MNSRIERQLEELLSADVISTETAQKITEFYVEKEDAKPNRLFTIFGILGALLCGLGLILIIAHNWDGLSKNIKTVIAFIPLLMGQIICLYSMVKKKGTTWVEASTTFLILAVGATISLVSQVYNIPGDLSTFLLTWIAITAPLMYLMRSYLAVIIHLILASWYAYYLGAFYSGQVPWWYLPQFAWVVPFYINLQKNKPESNIAGVLNWLMPLSLVVTLGAYVDGDTLAFVMYMGLYGSLYNIGQLPFFKKQKLRRNGHAIIGSLGMVSLSVILTFKWFWKDAFIEANNGLELGLTAVLFALGIAVLCYLHLKKLVRNFNLFQYAFLIVGLLYILSGISAEIMMILMNILVAALGLFALRIGLQKNSYGILNYGLAIIAVLIACRFFDTDLDFIVRGLLFIAVGAGFFFANYIMLKKQRKTSRKITSNTQRNE